MASWAKLVSLFQYFWRRLLAIMQVLINISVHFREHIMTSNTHRHHSQINTRRQCEALMHIKANLYLYILFMSHSITRTFSTAAITKIDCRLTGTTWIPESSLSLSSLQALAPAERRKIPLVNGPSWNRNTSMSCRRRKRCPDIHYGHMSLRLLING